MTALTHENIAAVADNMKAAGVNPTGRVHPGPDDAALTEEQVRFYLRRIGPDAASKLLDGLGTPIAREKSEEAWDKIARSGCIEVKSGVFIDVFNPDPDHIDIGDISHNLSGSSRFSAALHKFGPFRDNFSVAEHSWHVSRKAGQDFAYLRGLMQFGVISASEFQALTGDVPTWQEAARMGLMHDASEAYLVDIPTPIKKHLANYKEIECRLQLAICKKFGISAAMPPFLKEIDGRMCLTEKMKFLSPNGLDHPDWIGLSSQWKAYEDHDYHAFMTRGRAKRLFLKEFDTLFGEIG